MRDADQRSIVTAFGAQSIFDFRQSINRTTQSVRFASAFYPLSAPNARLRRRSWSMVVSALTL